ncbi:hypothetical protein O6P43_017610 [Quillaja saponaria]|uniref:Secreted protein n=1 Tax=Quillaja saponaria TaxID=32244 RepID=A0AAD7LQL6_QUISA|nr:hypothetical protein O6P43_017610 [Quillaja saponaria]
MPLFAQKLLMNICDCHCLCLSVSMLVDDGHCHLWYWVSMVVDIVFDRSTVTTVDGGGRRRVNEVIGQVGLAGCLGAGDRCYITICCHK